MRFDLDKAMGVHEQALYVRAKRTSLIASNLANSDTPNYKARDIDFNTILRNSAGYDDGSMLVRTNDQHIQPGGSTAEDAELLYRYPFQASLDGNTVDAQVEKARFSENTVMYQSTMQFLTGRMTTLRKAIKGGE